MNGSQVVVVSDISNEEFIERYARPGCVGLAGGPGIIEKAIRRAQRRQRPDRSWSEWGHAFLFQGKRLDGRHWVMESDLEIHRRNIRLGVQENRATKYHDEDYFDRLGIMDFNLTDEQAGRLVVAGLDLLAGNTQYSLREIFGTYLALRNILSRESTTGLLTRERSLFCSAFVQHLYLQIGMDFTPNVDTKHTTPEDIAQTQIPHTFYLLKRSRDKELEDEG